MTLPHPAPFALRWRARWIWHGAPAIVPETATRPVLADPTDRVVLLRRVLHLDAVPDSVPARLWSDGRHVLAVNGVEVARGPVRSDPRRPHEDVVDLGPHLRPGENVLAVTARHFGRATSWWIPAPPTYTLGAGSVVFEALVGDEWVVSDGTWRSAEGSAWTAVDIPGDVASLPLESFDARRHPWGWDAPGFDDSTWAAATEILPFHTGARGDLHPPSTPFGAIAPPVRNAFPGGAVHTAHLAATATVSGSAPGPDPVRQVLADEQRSAADAGTAPGGTPEDAVTLLSFDLGRVAAGTVRLEVAGATSGTVIDLAAAEHLDAEGRLVTLGQHAGLRYVCAGSGDPEGSGAEHFESLEIIGTRHVHASVRPPDGAPVPTITLRIADRHRPRPAGASFECSDPELNHIHAVGLRTVDLCALDAYVDCPTREQRAWTGDSVVHQMVDLVANPDWSMARWHPRLAATPRPDGLLPMAAASDFTVEDRMIVPDWSLHWVRSVWNLYRYTGDADLVAPLLPVAVGTLRWFESYLGDDGLVHDVPGWVLLDWASVYSDGCSSVLNALWARALEDVVEMATWLGDVGTASWAESRLAGVHTGFGVFWDPERRLVVDHLVDGERQRPVSQHAGGAALAAGLVPERDVADVVAAITDRSRLLRHSWVMDTVTPTGGSVGFIHLTTGYPPPTWDTDRQLVAAEPFFRYVVHDGLARAGRADLVAELCRDWQVFVDAGETTWPECWGGGTRCHGWSSTPTRDLVVHTLGITPAEPGYASVRVDPALGDLEWARATVPTPHGPLSVEARADGTVEIDSPVPVVRGPASRP